MKKRLILLFFGICFLVNSAFTANNDYIWLKHYGGREFNQAFDMKPTSDGGFIICGRTRPIGINDSVDVYLLKTDSVGTLEWERTYSNTVMYDEAKGVLQTSDGGYIVVGGTVGPDLMQVYVIRTNSLGDTLWTKIHGYFGQDEGFSVVQTPDGGFVIAGECMYVHGQRGVDLYLLKLDANGNFIWERFIGGHLYDGGRSIQMTNDGGFIVVGTTQLVYNQYIYLVKTFCDGNVDWTRIYGGGGGGEDEGWQVKQTTDGGYIIAGTTEAPHWGSTFSCLIKTDPFGTTQWNRYWGLGYGDVGFGVVQTSDSGYVLTGRHCMWDPIGNDTIRVNNVFLVKTDAYGNDIWEYNYGAYGSEVGWRVTQTSDGGLVVAGNTDMFGPILDEQVILFKISPNGDAINGFSRELSSATEINSSSVIKISPNPFNPTTTLTYSLPISAEVSLIIYDISGREVTRLVDGWRSAGVHGRIWNAAGLPSGVYFAKLQASNCIQTQKVILLK